MHNYQKNIDTLFEELHTSKSGISNEEVSERQKKYGVNELEAEEQESALSIFLSQYKDLWVIILIISGFISAFTGEMISALVIFIVITMNAILGTYQTLQARKSLDSLKKLALPHVKVLRNGQLCQISSNELVVGDVVYVEAGDVIEGDGRIIECHGLQINESALTGESLAQEKTLEPIEQECGIGDQTNMVFSSSLVTNGTGYYVVCAVGMQTEIGKIATMLQNAEERKTPLQITLEQFSEKLTISICVLCALILVLNVWIAKEPLMEALLIAVALAVAAIPEALGSIVTIVLSISTQKMVKEHAIIKELNAVESLGCVSVICSDKTGTLTQNKMTVTQMYLNQETITDLDANDYCHELLLKAGWICNNAVVNEEEAIGDPTEIALIDLCNKYIHEHPGYQIQAKRMEEIPFDSVRKRMSVSSLHHIYTKGAVDQLLPLCNSILIHHEKRELTQEDIQNILDENKNMAKQGLRVLAFAYKRIDDTNISLEDENNLTFIGLVAQMDPPRVESQEAVAQCLKAGIKPIMITGDHIVTARAIASQIGIYQEGDLCLEGGQVEKMSDEELDEVLPKVSVYARVAPKHKIRIVKHWQKRGQIVAMTGDGVNDAPALKQSDIGVAMGITGTEVSKDAASMILTDDNFATIVKAVITGRNVYANIKNAIIYLLSGNLSAIIMVLYATLRFLPNPFLAVHLLFINLVTDSLPAIAIGMEPHHADVINQKPRKKEESILNASTMKRIGIQGVIIFIFVLIAYHLGLRENKNIASTMAFATLCLSRLFHGFTCRGNQVIFKMEKNKYSIYAFLAGFVLLSLILLVPALHTIFSIGAITIYHYGMICLCAFGSFVIMQILQALHIWKD